jgi:hypothetical protein
MLPRNVKTNFLLCKVLQLSRQLCEMQRYQLRYIVVKIGLSAERKNIEVLLGSLSGTHEPRRIAAMCRNMSG